MPKTNKILQKMLNNPSNWRIEQVETVAKSYKVNVRKTGGSHVIFEHQDWIELLSVPAHRPIKPIYIKKFVKLIELLQGDRDEAK